MDILPIVCCATGAVASLICFIMKPVHDRIRNCLSKSYFTREMTGKANGFEPLKWKSSYLIAGILTLKMYIILIYNNTVPTYLFIIIMKWSDN